MNTYNITTLELDLVKAIANKSLSTIKELIEPMDKTELEHPDVKKILENLFLAASRKSLPIVEYLLTSEKFYIDIDIQNNFALRKAISNNQLDIVDFLTTSDKLKQTISVTTYGPFTSVLTHACSQGNVEILKFLLTSPKLVQKPDIHLVLNNGESPLSAACRNANIEVVKFLLNDPAIKKENPQWKNVKDNSPLLAACYDGALEVFKYLLFSKELKEHWCLEEHKEMCAYIACCNGSLSILKFIVDNTENLQLNFIDEQHTPFLRAVYNFENDENHAEELIHYILYDLKYKPTQQEYGFLEQKKNAYNKTDVVLKMIEKRDLLLNLEGNLQNEKKGSKNKKANKI